MTTNDFQVTTGDFEHYLLAQGFDDERKARALSREGAVAQVFENFYLLRSLAADGARNEAIDKDQVEWMVANYRDKLLMERQLELEVAAAMEEVDLESLAREEYKANKEQYQSPEEVGAAHILISLSERSEEEAQEIANTVMEKLEAGEDFGKLAQEYSDDEGTKVKDGSLGYFTRGRMVKPFEEAAFALKDGEVGDISPLIKSRFGFHVIKLEGYKPGGQRSFEEAKPRILKLVEGRTRTAKQREIMTEIQADASERGLQVDLELLDSLVAKYAPEDLPTEAVEAE
ncbi:MAG: hypothetical protein HKN19_02930 [Halioglobus sp.]|nr:hypothetical protein [Halioglobus sp.]